MTGNSPASVGLGGDGDEIAAIEAVEHAFSVRLDDADAPGWRTAGDVYASLLRKLGPDAAADPGNWDRFAAVLARETAIDPGTIEPGSPLLIESTPALKMVVAVILLLAVAAALTLSLILA